MKSPYVADLVITTTDKDQGNLLASLFAAEPGDEYTFDHAAALRPVGTSDPAVRWGGIVQVKQNVYGAVLEFNSAGPYPNLNLAGLTNQDVADFKAIVQMQVVPRGTGYQVFLGVLQTLNLEII